LQFYPLKPSLPQGEENFQFILTGVIAAPLKVDTGGMLLSDIDANELPRSKLRGIKKH